MNVYLFTAAVAVLIFVTIAGTQSLIDYIKKKYKK